jgi:hypothetical protein
MCKRTKSSRKGTLCSKELKYQQKPFPPPQQLKRIRIQIQLLQLLLPQLLSQPHPLLKPPPNPQPFPPQQQLKRIRIQIQLPHPLLLVVTPHPLLHPLLQLQWL